MKNNKTFFYGKLILILVLSLIISSFLIKEIFLSYTPRPRPDFIARLKRRLVTLFKPNLTIKKIEPKESSQPTEEKKVIVEILKRTLRPVAKGIRASSYKNYSYLELKLNEIEWVVIDFTDPSGRKMKIRVPKGTEHLFLK